MASSSCSSPSSSSKMQFKCSTPKPQPMDETTKEDVDGEQLLDWRELRTLCDEHLLSGDCQTAAFWAEKLLALSSGRTLNERLPDIAHYLSVLTAAQFWQTIIMLIERHDLFPKHLVFAFFHVNALFHRELYSEIISLPVGYLCHWDDVPFIQPDSATYICAENDAVKEPKIRQRLDAFVREKKYEGRLLLLLAKTYLMVQNRPAASGCLKHCLAANPFCSEAIHLAVDSRLISARELRAIIGCQYNQQKTGQNSSGARVIAHLLEIYDLGNEPTVPPSGATSRLAQLLAKDLSVQSATAYRLYARGSVHEAYQISAEIMHEYGYYSKCFLVHVACLVHLNKVSELYQLGHQMVKLQPERETTWYTVGCYYYSTGQYTTAKKFLNKCTMMNSGFGEGWLAYGHALFYMEEHEQAMNCYLRASRILEGHFEPLLYIAVEYCFANNFKLAADFLTDAAQVAGANALVMHEQAATAFMENDFKKAEQILMEALRLLVAHAVVVVDDGDPNGGGGQQSVEQLMAAEVNDFWEPLYNNLGHVLRKLGRYTDAIHVHRKSLLLSGAKADAWACLGVCYASLAGTKFTANANTEAAKLAAQATEALNRALALKPGDDLVKTALDRVMQFEGELLDTVFEVHENVDDKNYALSRDICMDEERLR
uniref:Uncharacterized protein n=1 Tax=Globodera rostochiensis TaxID=31243 RepID=A0A914IBQ8_GLORO